MKIKIDSKYIALPVNNNVANKKLCFYEENANGKELVLNYDCKIDLLNPVYTSYIDMSEYLNKELILELVPEMEFEVKQVNERHFENLYKEEYRPYSHFTPKLGWINDPNGLIKFKDTYHLFYQYNPCATEWGNMHWGHAVSKDLVHWEEMDTAISPDNMGTAYSGSAIEDENNITGLKKGEENPMLLYYTAAADRSPLSKGKKRTQCLVYSLDGGKTFEKYANNPVVPWIEQLNRDPKVVFSKELGKYVMVIYLADDRYGILTSSDLINWEFLQEISVEGDSECPDIYPISVDGEDFYVIMGAVGKYLFGKFEDGKFVKYSGTKQLEYGKCYAAQSYSGIDDGRVIRIGWDKIYMPCKNAPHQMGIPVSVVGEKVDGELYIKALPVKETETLYESTFECENFELDSDFVFGLKEKAYDIHYVSDFEGVADIWIFGYKLHVDTEENLLRFLNAKIPLSLDKLKVDIRIIVDRCSFEIFADGGRSIGTLLAVNDYNLPYIKVTSKDNINIKYIRISELENIH